MSVDALWKYTISKKAICFAEFGVGLRQAKLEFLACFCAEVTARQIGVLDGTHLAEFTVW